MEFSFKISIQPEIICIFNNYNDEFFYVRKKIILPFNFVYEISLIYFFLYKTAIQLILEYF